MTAITKPAPKGALLPTDERPGETPEECVTWFGWCKGLFELDEALAAKHAWTQRRNQLEGMGRLAEDPAARMQQAMFNGLDVVAIGMREHILSALENPERVRRELSVKDGIEVLLKAANTPAPQIASPITDLLLNAPPEIKEKALALQTWIAGQLTT